MTNPAYNQNGFGFYDDTSSWNFVSGLSENDNHTATDGTRIIIRVEVEVTNAKSVNNAALAIYAAKNGGTYALVNQARADGFRSAASSWFTDGDSDNVDRLTSSSLTFNNIGELDDDGVWNEATGGLDFGGQDHIELGQCIQIDTANASDTDYWDIQVKLSGADLNGYTRTPRITYSAPAAVRRTFVTHV